jgi:hypothetical protein
MIPKPLPSITLGDIESLVTNSIREGKTIEYKQELIGGKDAEKKEFLADVSSFANASGGDIIFGVAESRDADGKPTGIPEAITPLPGLNADKEILRLEQMIRGNIDPKIPGLASRAIDGHQDGPLILIRIPQSWSAPHMITFNASPRFYTRRSNGKSPLDLPEIRAAFVQSELLPEKIRRFREQRLGQIVAGETPVTLQQESLIVLHLVPISAFLGTTNVDVVPFMNYKHILSPIGGNITGRRLNIDGFVSYHVSKRDGFNTVDYVQLFRNGIVEAVDSYLLTMSPKKRLIYLNDIENQLIGATEQFIEVFSKIGVDPPIVAMLSLLNVAGFCRHRPDFIPVESEIDRRHLLLPDVVLDDVTLPPEMLLKPVFDVLSQACGSPCSARYIKK